MRMELGRLPVVGDEPQCRPSIASEKPAGGETGAPCQSFVKTKHRHVQFAPHQAAADL